MSRFQPREIRKIIAACWCCIAACWCFITAVISRTGWVGIFVTVVVSAPLVSVFSSTCWDNHDHVWEEVVEAPLSVSHTLVESQMHSHRFFNPRDCVNGVTHRCVIQILDFTFGASRQKDLDVLLRCTHPTLCNLIVSISNSRPS